MSRKAVKEIGVIKFVALSNHLSGEKLFRSQEFIWLQSEKGMKVSVKLFNVI